MSEPKRMRLEENDADMKQAVSCSICLEIFKQPVILPSCGHSFCFECIKRVIGDKTIVTCPECRVISKLGNQGVNGLLRNILARRMAELLTESSASTSVQSNSVSLRSKCNHVTSRKNHCSHCDSSFCDSCLVAHIELLKMSATWISSNFSSRYAAAVGSRDEVFNKEREKIETAKQNAKTLVEIEAEALLNKLREVIKRRKGELFHEIDAIAEQHLYNVQSIGDSLPPQREIESVVSRVKQASHKSPLFLKIDEMAQVHDRALELDAKLQDLEGIDSDLAEIRLLLGNDPDLLVAEVRNVLKAEFRVKLELDSHQSGIPKEEWRFREACRAGELQTVKNMLDQLPHAIRDYVANLEEKDDEYSFSPLALAVSSGNLALVRYFVEEVGVDFKSVAKYFAYGSARCDCDGADHLTVIKYMLERSPELLKTLGSDENTLLHWAASSGLADVITFLVKEKGFDVNARNRRGETPLFKAASHPQALKLLIDLGANVNVVTLYNATIAHWVAELGDVETFKFLHQLSPQLPAGGNQLFRSPLCTAAKAGHYDLVAYILDNCVNVFKDSSEPDDIRDEAQIYTLRQLVISDQLAILELLADRGGVKLDQEEASLLECATDYDKSRIVRMLLQRFPISLTQKNEEDETLIDYAIKHNHHAIARYLASCHQILSLLRSSSSI